MKRLLIVVVFFFVTTIQAKEVRLTLASSWNRQQNFTALFMQYVENVNRVGKGIVQIDFIGGPEAIPQRQLFYALRRGVIDMAFGGITYYRGVLPEGDAIFASTITPMQARRTGALDALQPYWRKRINSRLVGWVQSGIGVNIYLIDEPHFKPDGMPDLSGLIIRTSPSNREILTQLGGRAVQIAVKEIYTALQRGIVDGMAFTTTGIPDLGIEEFIRYRIDPAFLQLAVCLQINLDQWNGLSPEARKIIEDQAIAYEKASRREFFALQKREMKYLEQQGLRGIPVPGDQAANYRALAHDVVWERLALREPESARELKTAFLSGGSPVTRIYDGLIKGLAGFAGLLLVAVCLIIVYDVAARNLGMQPPHSTVALTEYALLYFTMAAAPYLVRMRGHIVVEIVYQRASAAVRRHLDPIILSICALISLLVAGLSGVLLIEAVLRTEIEIRSLDTPRWILFAPLVTGFFFMGVEFLRLLFVGESVFRSASEQVDSF